MVVQKIMSLLEHKNQIKNALLIGDPGYGSPELVELLYESKHNLTHIKDLEELSALSIEQNIQLVLVQASKFSVTDVMDQLKTSINVDNALVKFISNEV